MLEPAIQFKSIETNALDADGHLDQIGAHLSIEAVAVHAEVMGGVAEPEDAGLNI